MHIEKMRNNFYHINTKKEKCVYQIWRKQEDRKITVSEICNVQICNIFST